MLTYRGANEILPVCVVLNAYRPDPQTVGVFQHASKVYEVPTSWNPLFHRIVLVKEEDNKLTAFATVGISSSIGCAVIIALFLILSGVFWNVRKI